MQNKIQYTKKWEGKKYYSKSRLKIPKVLQFADMDASVEINSANQRYYL